MPCTSPLYTPTTHPHALSPTLTCTSALPTHTHTHSRTRVQVVGDRSSVKEYLRLLSSALALVNPSEPAQLAKVKAFAVEAVKAFVRSPDIFQCDFWELPAVQQLGRESNTAPLLKLMDVMLNGDLAGGGEEGGKSWGEGGEVPGGRGKS